MLKSMLAVIAVVGLVWETGSHAQAGNGQLLIDAGQYEKAIREFTRDINARPTDIDGYRGRIEAKLLLGRFSDAVQDYARVTALVMPVHPDAANIILDGYADRLAVAPNNIPALTGASFARWWFFDYAAAIHLLNRLLVVRPNDVYGNLFRGSSRLLHHAALDKGVADLERAIALAPDSPDVSYIVADAYTYGLPDPNHAFEEVIMALDGGLDTPRIHAILASAYFAFGDQAAAATEILIHFELVTDVLLTTSDLAADTSQTLDLVPGLTFEIPVPAIAGETLAITTSSRDFYDTIAVLLAPDGSPVTGGDDNLFYFAAFDYIPNQTGTYRLLVTSFESVNTGELEVIRD